MRRFKTSLLALALGTGSLARGQTCRPLPSEKQSALVEYVGKEYKLNKSSGLRLAKENLVPGSCYRALTFEGKSQVRTWQLTLYLSPDQRFLTGELFDTTVDPIREERRKAEALMAALAPNKGSSRGPDGAPVTIVEFSDFECPFCRRFADIIRQVLPNENDGVRIVFHHMPLQMHPWAHVAAEGAACAQLQNRMDSGCFMTSYFTTIM